MNLDSGARAIPRRLRASHDGTVKERGEQDARDRLSIFIGCQCPVPARRFLTKVLRSCRRSGLRNRTWPVRAFGPYTGQTRRPSPDPLPAFRQPRRTGRSVVYIDNVWFFAFDAPSIPGLIPAVQLAGFASRQPELLTRSPHRRGRAAAEE